MPELCKDLNSIIKRGKDVTDRFDNVGVVYKINCLDCSKSYVGETKRKLGTRINEHQRDVKIKKDTVISSHCNNHNHKLNWKNVKILDREKLYRPRLISEMLHISSQQSPLNKKEDTFTLASSYKLLISTLRNL